MNVQSRDEGWVYNDNVNSPEIRAWLDKVVGKEGEDLSRHDKWLCMMYPRLRLLREFLREDGALLVSIDDNAAHQLKLVLDEIFGGRNFLGTFVWERDAGSRGDSGFSSSHDYILAYARKHDHPDFKLNFLERTEKQSGRFSNPDNDPRGPWRQGDDGTAKSGTDKQKFPITLPSGRVVTPKRYWAFSIETFKTAKAEGRVYFGKKGDSLPVIKRYLQFVREGVAPRSWLPADLVGTNQSAKRDHLRKLLPTKEPFATPKPETLVGHLIKIFSDEEDVILDSFAGSGTTASTALKMRRKFIVVEMLEDVSDYMVPRLKRVIDGEDEFGVTAESEWLGGGGFRFCRLGTPLFDEFGDVAGEVTFADLAAHIFFSETGVPIPHRAQSEFLGVFQDRAVYLLFDAAHAETPREAAGNVLTPDRLDALPDAPDGFEGTRVIYAEGCTVSADRLKRAGAAFKQIPYQIDGVR